jgi:1,4-alpha-glucan branching enzyme
MSCAYFSKLAHVVLNKNWKERARAAAWRPKEEPLVRWKLSLYRKEQENMHKRNKNQTSHATGAGIATGTQIEVRFALERADANQVYLCGDFNEWSATNLPMIRREAGRWEKRVTLPPGRYEYKFIVDGTWTADPSGAQEVVNAFGSTNSVVEVRGRTEAKYSPPLD